MFTSKTAALRHDSCLQLTTWRIFSLILFFWPRPSVDMHTFHHEDAPLLDECRRSKGIPLPNKEKEHSCTASFPYPCWQKSTLIGTDMFCGITQRCLSPQASHCQCRGVMSNPQEAGSTKVWTIF